MYKLLLLSFLFCTHLVNAQDYINHRGKKTRKAKVSRVEQFKIESKNSEETKIQGTVLESKTREFLQGVNIFLEGTTLGAMSGFDGGFEIKNVKPGNFTIVFQYIGFEPYKQTIEIKENQTIILTNIELVESEIGLEEVKIIASSAKEGMTPVAVHQVSLKNLQQVPGYQEFPNVISQSPAIFSSRRGGAFGDSRVSIRGFDQSNIAVLINGVPVNDMADGKMYWSNWSSLKDVTRSIQIQRGIGASRLSIGSVGGTINILTKTSDFERKQQVGVHYSSEFNGFKYDVSGSTGRLKNGLSISFAASYLHGKGYVEGTQVQAGSYFLSATQEIGKKHLLMFTLFGSPQIHGQKETADSIPVLEKRGLFYNPDYGFYNNEAKNVRINFYHKPLSSLTHVFSISDKTTLSSTIYASVGRGYGSSSVGSLSRTAEGYVDWDKIYSKNQAADTNYVTSSGETVSGKASSTILRNGYNNHNWFGLLSILSHQISSQLKCNIGIDLRTYKGHNYRTVRDLLGGDFFIEKSDINNPGRATRVGDKIAFDVMSYISWSGGFAELAYESKKWNAYASFSAAQTFYRRKDFFNYKPENQLSAAKSIFGFTSRAGVSYQILPILSVFANAGYYSRAPFINFVYVNSLNDLAQNIKNERIQSLELGTEFIVEKFRFKFNVYHTLWMDKFYLSKKITNSDGSQTSARINGINALHKGLEFEGAYIPVKRLEISFFGGIGDWRWKNNVETEIVNDQGQTVETVKLFINNLKVAEAPQTNMGIKIEYNPWKKIIVGTDLNYFDQIYTSFDFTKRNVSTDTAQPYRIPSYSLLNLFANYTFELKNTTFRFTASVNNVLDTKYLSEGLDAVNHTRNSSLVYYGFGRTYNAGIQLMFK